MDLLAVVELFRRRWIPLFLAVLAGVGGAVVVTARTADRYESTSRLFVNLPVASGVQEALQGVQLSSQLLESYAAIATSRATAERIDDDLGGRLTAGEVQASVRAEVRPNTLLLDVIARSDQPALARDLADAAAEAVVEVISDLESNKQNPVEAQIIDKAALPLSPVEPKPLENGLTGLGIGLAVGLALALILDSLDRPAPVAVDAPAPASAPAPAPAVKAEDLAGELRLLHRKIDELLKLAAAPPPPPPARAPAKKAAPRPRKAAVAEPKPEPEPEATPEP